MPKTVHEIGDGAFAFCNKLRHIILSEGIESIGSYAFAECVSLKTIIIPQSCQKIGTDAFLNCDNLEYVILLNPNLEVYSLKYMIDTGVPNNCVIVKGNKRIIRR